MRFRSLSVALPFFDGYPEIPINPILAWSNGEFDHMDRGGIKKPLMVVSLLIVGCLAIAAAIFLMMDREREATIFENGHELSGTVDSYNKTLTLVEPNRTIDWNQYVVKVNDTYTLRSTSVAVPGTSTDFHHSSWAPIQGCEYRIAVLKESNHRIIWSADIVAE